MDRHHPGGRVPLRGPDVTRRLVASYIVLAFVIVAMLAYPLGRVFASRERDRLLRDIEHDAVVAASFVEDALEQAETPVLTAELADYGIRTGGRIVVVNTNGRSVADTDPNAALGADFTNRSEIAAALQGKRAEGSRHSTTAGGPLFYVALPVASSGTVHGAVRVTYPGSTLTDRVNSLWILLASIAALVMLAAGALGFLLARVVVRPVKRLTAAALQLAAGDMDARAPDDTNIGEMRTLAQAFNQSADHVVAALETQQAFVADASHQLRTPLAALRLLLENIEEDAPTDLQPALAAARAETSRLTRISDSLLVLARTPTTARTIEAFDLVPVLRGRAELWLAVAEGLSIDLHTDLPDSLWVQASIEGIEQIVDNLLDNAMEAAPSNSKVELRAAREEQSASIHVLDRGPGLTDADRSRAFDRFWRGANATPGGTGLGLAIVAQLANASGGSVRLDSRDGGGIDAVVQLVLAPAIRPS